MVYHGSNLLVLVTSQSKDLEKRYNYKYHILLFYLYSTVNLRETGGIKYNLFIVSRFRPDFRLGSDVTLSDCGIIW